MAKTRQQKEESVAEFVDRLNHSKSVVFVDYKGMTMGQLSDLRKKLREQEAEFTVTKNTLMDLSLKQAGLETQASEGPTATLFASGDEILPIKTLVKALKDNGVGQIKGGFLNTEFLDAFGITRLANLPSKQELQAKTVGILVAPLQGMVGVLQANLRNLVYALNQIQLQKGGE